jgi:predicted transcriptional regulator
MAKITITLSDETEKKLRSYVTSKYPEKPFGKLSYVVEEALIEYLEKHSK